MTALTTAKRYLRRGLPRRWWLPLALAAGVLAGLVTAVVKDPVYQAEATVAVVADDRAHVGLAVNFAQAYSRIATEPGILAASGAHLAAGDLLRDAVRASASPDAPVIRLTAAASTAAEAAARANSVADALAAYGNARTRDTGMRLAQFSRAFPPPAPSSPVMAVNVAVGAACGLLLGMLAHLAPPVRRPREDQPAESTDPAGTGEDGEVRREAELQGAGA